ncbi:unannotated protein [freshwater metagenome]|uniref:Unannotated protein n=1 Tax=freshwater metagenome TaxID=449393 RepID=A0A6J6I793_9ZZZZ
MTPVSHEALRASGTFLPARIVWKVVASAPTEITTHLSGLYPAVFAVEIATAVAEATAAMIAI